MGMMNSLYAERMEGRGLVKENPSKQTSFRTQSLKELQHALDRIHQAAVKDKSQ